MPSPQAILSQENNFDCSKTVDQSILAEAAGSNYFIQLADPFNNTNVRIPPSSPTVYLRN